MEDIALVKEFLTRMLDAVKLVEQLGDLEAAAKALETRVASLKKQEADIIAYYDEIRRQAEGNARITLETAKEELAKLNAEHERFIKAKTDHAQAELDTISRQRDGLHAEIASLGQQTSDLRSQKEQTRQELAFYRDGAATAKAEHERAKTQLIELRQTLDAAR